jgi:HTH-type transcriptional regulator/antitoxin HigA
MTIKLIRTKEDYESALLQIEKLMGREGTPDEEEELAVLALLVERYEESRYVIEKVDPITALHFRMEQQGLSQKDLVPILGSASRVSEVLAGKRGLSLNMIRRLVHVLGIPAEILIGDVVPMCASQPRRVRKNVDTGNSARISSSGLRRRPAKP